MVADSQSLCAGWGWGEINTEESILTQEGKWGTCWGIYCSFSILFSCSSHSAILGTHAAASSKPLKMPDPGLGAVDPRGPQRKLRLTAPKCLQGPAT